MGIENKFSWSKTRHQVFRECPRKYYYNYYASWGGWYEDAPKRTREIYILKKLTTIPMWVGNRVHDAVGTSLENLRYEVKLLDKNKIISLTLQKMRAEFVNSKAGKYRINPKILGLFEHEYAIENDEDTWREYTKHIAKCLNNFYDSKIFVKLTEVGKENFLTVEDLDTFQFSNTPIYVKIDCAIQNDNVHIFDWKTGKGFEEDTLFQLVGYALYAKDKWSVPLEKIVVHEFNIFSNKETSQKVGKEEVSAFKGTVKGSISDMKSLLADPNSNIPKEENAYTAVDDDRVCIYCNFQSVCPVR